MIVLLTSKKLPALFLLTNDISAIFICSPLCLAFFIQILYLLIIQNHLEFLAVEDPIGALVPDWHFFQPSSYMAPIKSC